MTEEWKKFMHYQMWNGRGGLRALSAETRK